MATTVTHIIDPDTGAGYDYASLNAWATAEVGDLTGVRDEIAVASCRNSSGGSDGTELYLNGWTTSATQYIQIEGRTGYRATAEWDNNHYRLYNSTAYTRCMRINQRHVRVIGIQIHQAYTGASGDCQAIDVLDVSAGVSDIRFIGNIIRGSTSNTSTSAHGINFSALNTAAFTYIVNNVFYELGENGISLGFSTSNRGTIAIYNNTFYSCGNAGIRTLFETTVEGELYLYNNLVMNTATSDYILTGTGVLSTYSHDNNLSEDATSPDAAHQSKYISFVSAGSINLNLVVGDTDAIDDGTDLHADAIYAFSDDINIAARSEGSWDIGAAEYGGLLDPTPNVYDNISISDSITVEKGGFALGHTTAYTGSTDDLTQAFTCEAKTKILVLGIAVAGSTNREAVAPTYNAVNMVQADIVRKYVTSPETNIELWYMIDPPVSASYNIIIPNSGTRTLWCKATSFMVSGFGDAILDLATGNTGNTSNPSVSIVTTTDEALIYGILGDGTNSAPSAQTGTNINRTAHSTYSENNQYWIQTSAGSWACGWTVAADDWGMCVVAFKLSFGISVEECVAPNAVFGRN